MEEDYSVAAVTTGREFRHCGLKCETEGVGGYGWGVDGWDENVQYSSLVYTTKEQVNTITCYDGSRHDDRQNEWQWLYKVPAVGLYLYVWTTGMTQLDKLWPFNIHVTSLTAAILTYF